jgi:soluble lytic murein transglycosylase-like protein
MKMSNLLYIKPLLLLTGLVACSGVMAIEVETSVELQQNTQESAAPSTSITNNRLNTTGTLKNPNSMLVAMAFKFKSIEGSPRDYAEVAANYCKKAKLGDADAQFALGWMYANGKGVSTDERTAAQLFTMAAEQGHTSAQESLAKLSNVSPSSTLLACLLPDPPTSIASDSALDTAQNERNGISDKTAALFYSQHRILKLVNKLAPRYEIDANLVMTFIAVESGFNAQATSPKNAQGLMQLIPQTAVRFGVKDAYKAEDNIRGGLAYLQWLLAYYKGDIKLVAAAYNAGEGAVEKYKGVPPYAETQMYVKKIAKLYNNTSHPYKDNLVKASPILNVQKNKTM